MLCRGRRDQFGSFGGGKPPPYGSLFVRSIIGGRPQVAPTANRDRCEYAEDGHKMIPCSAWAAEGVGPYAACDANSPGYSDQTGCVLQGRRGRRPLRRRSSSAVALTEDAAAHGWPPYGGCGRIRRRLSRIRDESARSLREAPLRWRGADAPKTAGNPPCPARADDIRPYSTPASQSLPDRANEFQSVFPATCAAEKLPEAKRHASPRADQPSEARAMERESFQGEPHRGSPWTLKKAGLFCKARQDRVSASDDAKG